MQVPAACRAGGSVRAQWITVETVAGAACLVEEVESRRGDAPERAGKGGVGAQRAAQRGQKGEQWRSERDGRTR